MNAKTILFPTDFSTGSDAALEQATALAREAGAKMLIIHVGEPLVAHRSDGMYDGISELVNDLGPRREPDYTAILRMLHDVRPRDPGVPYEHRLLQGDPAERIVEIADEENCELIVMGTHGRTGFRRLLMGSVAEAVVRRANCAVFTYKLPRTRPAASPKRRSVGEERVVQTLRRVPNA